MPRIARASRSLMLLVGAPAGSGIDTSARAFAPFLERHLPHTEIGISNLPGESGLVAYRALATADATGATFGWVSTPSLPARMVDRAGNDLMDRLTLLGSVQKEPVVIVSPSASPLTSAADIFKRAATDADSVPFGTPSAGSPPHLAALRLQVLAATQLNIVAFPSSAAARQAVLAGNVGAAALALGDAIGGLREGKLVGLGIAARQPLDAFPDMPRLQDAGLPLTASIQRGLAAPAATPAEALEPVIAAMRAVVADPEFVDQGEDGGFFAHWLDGPAWTAQAGAERIDLSRLWESDPWLPTGTG
jgi:tripartite-type tricarboxylate transporter receptor subunit TctC